MKKISYISLTFLLVVYLGIRCASVPIEAKLIVMGSPFPRVSGEDLNGNRVLVPIENPQKPFTVLLVGYVQRAQFDCDRWILGLSQLETPANLLELPTITGMLPGMFAGRIDSGMRSGIPAEDWGSVVTLYGNDATEVVNFLGNRGGANAHVVVLDIDGRVIWFHDRGYSASKVMEVDALVRSGKGAY